MTLTGSCLLYFPFLCLSFFPTWCLWRFNAPHPSSTKIEVSLSFIVQCFSKSNVHQLRILVKWTFSIWKVWGGTEGLQGDTGVAGTRNHAFMIKAVVSTQKKVQLLGELLEQCLMGHTSAFSWWLLHHRLIFHQSALGQVTGVCGTNHGTLCIKIPMALEVAVYRIWYK